MDEVMSEEVGEPHTVQEQNYRWVSIYKDGIGDE